MRKIFTLTGLVFLISANILLAQKTFNPMGQSQQVIWGHGYNQNSFSRFPADAEQTIPSAVWNQTLSSSGLHIRFITNATSITVNYRVKSQYSGNNWFSAVGANGLDMYARKPDGNWYWCYPNSRTVGSVFTYGNLNPGDATYTREGYEFSLYLPTFAVMSSITITVNAEANFEFIPVNNELKPIVVYGTSVVHGAVCSRPGNIWTSIVGRNFPDRPVVNLGFSGNGKVEPEVVDVINRIDAEIFVIDCLPNYSNPSMTSLIDQRYKSAIDKLTNSHPDAAILLTEHFGYADMDMMSSRKNLVLANNIELKKVYNYYVGKGNKNIFYLSLEDLNLDMSADIGDYVHPNDKGMYRFAEVYTAKIAEILNANSSQVTQPSQKEFNIYPNPNDGSFKLTLPESFQQKSSIEVIDMDGKVVYKKSITAGLNEQMISQLNLGAGNYILTLTKGKKKLTKGFIIQ